MTIFRAMIIIKRFTTGQSPAMTQESRPNLVYQSGSEVQPPIVCYFSNALNAATWKAHCVKWNIDFLWDSMKLLRLRKLGRLDRRSRVGLLDLPHDILGLILALVSVEDLIACLQTCRLLLHIGNKQWVWRLKYCNEFDSVSNISDWKQSFAREYQYWALRSPKVTTISNELSGNSPKTIYDADFDGESLAVSAWSDGSIQFLCLDPQSHKENVIKLQTPIYTCLLDSKRGVIYLGADSGLCILLCSRTMKLLPRILAVEKDEAILRIIETPRGVLFAGSKGTLSLLKFRGLKNDGPVVKFENAHSAAINGLAYSKRHDLIVTLSCDGRVKLWRWSETRGRLMCCRKYILNSGSSDMSCLSVYEDHFMVGGKSDGSIQVFSMIDGCRAGELLGHRRQVRTMHIDGKYMATGSYDGTVRLWDLKTHEPLQTIENKSSKSQWILSVRLRHRKVVYGAGSDCHLLEFR